MFSGKRVVVAGLGASGTDIALEICSVADKVYLSHNKSKHPGHLPENLVQVRLYNLLNRKTHLFMVPQGHFGL